jgi:hypothetical protein
MMAASSSAFVIFGIAEDRRPFTKGEIGRHDDRRPLAKPVDEVNGIEEAAKRASAEEKARRERSAFNFLREHTQLRITAFAGCAIDEVLAFFVRSELSCDPPCNLLCPSRFVCSLTGLAERRGCRPGTRAG